MAAAPPEQRLAEALRARATGAGQPPRTGHRAEVPPPDVGLPTALVIALLAGVLLGVALALVSLLLPGVLPGTA
jgi:hypothetical protein